MSANQSPPWPLSGPASLVLLWGPGTRDALVLSIAILEIAVRRDLRLRYGEVRRWFIYRRSKLVLTGNIDPATLTYQSLNDIPAAFPPPRQYGDGIIGVQVDEIGKHFISFVKAFRAEQERGLPTFDVRHGYVQSSVMPELEAWQFYARQHITGVSPSMHWVLTDKGNRALDALQQQMAFGRSSFDGLVTKDPRQATEFLEQAGSAVLLLRGLGKSYRRLLQTEKDTHSAWGEEGASSTVTGPTRSDGLAISVHLLAARRGPYPADDIDRALYAIVDELDRTWSRARRSGFFRDGE